MNPHYPLKFRKVKTKTGSTAIQVGHYEGKNFKIKKHIGSSKNKDKISELIYIANSFIESHCPQTTFDFDNKSSEIFFKRGITITKSRLDTAYEYLGGIYKKIGFSNIDSAILKHFVIMRVLEPASKVRTIELLKRYFDIEYKKTTVFRKLANLINEKDKVIDIAIKYAKKKLGFNFSLIFYDVTTLYFETHKEDEFRRNGFSKDNKINQPQILIGLVVNEDGFPIYYDIFKGNMFEGKTIIPVIEGLKRKYKISKVTIVADAGMLSAENIKKLEENKLDYIVGARIGNLKLEEIKEISKELNRVDKKTLTKENIVYEYSQKRASKDRVDIKKQVEKANYYLKNPTKIIRGSKFLAKIGKNKYKLNEELINKHIKLEGIKGYRTNITYLEPQKIIERYKDLWKVEKSFRISKTDLEARPIYHRKKESIEYHIMIVFMGLCVSKVIEMGKKESINKVVRRLKYKWTITITDSITKNSMNLVLDKNPH